MQIKTIALQILQCQLITYNQLQHYRQLICSHRSHRDFAHLCQYTLANKSYSSVIYHLLYCACTSIGETYTLSLYYRTIHKS